MRLLILSGGNLFFIHEQAYQIINVPTSGRAPRSMKVLLLESLGTILVRSFALRILLIHLSAAATCMRTLKIAHAFELN